MCTVFNMASKESSVLKCGLCQERYNCPKLLPCYHSFCLRCVDKVAGEKPSFPCPHCHTVILLPPGGASGLQTNISLERELTQDMSCTSPPCQLCDKDAVAEFKCVQCQQLYCTPCRQTHDSIPSSSAHDVLTITTPQQHPKHKSEGEKALKVCPKHKSQPLLLFCRPCDVAICMQCKLTSHEGHETEDVQDSAERAREELEEEAEELAHREQTLRAVLDKAEDHKAHLATAREEVDREIRARAEQLLNLVSEKRELALEELGVTAKEILSSMEEQADPVKIMLSKVSAKHQHYNRVLRGTDYEAIGLATQLRKEETAQFKEPKAGAVSIEGSSIQLDFNPSVVIDINVRDFIGSPIEVDGHVIAVPEMERPSLLHIEAPSSKKRSAALAKKLPGAKEIVYSQNSKATLLEMCLAQEDKVWVVYKFTDVDNHVVALYDFRGQRLETHHITFNVSRRLVCVDDTLLSVYDGKFIDAGGRRGENKPANYYFGWMFSKKCSGGYYCAKYGETIGMKNERCKDSPELFQMSDFLSSPPELDTVKLSCKSECSDFGLCIENKKGPFALSSDENHLALLNPASQVNVLIRIEEEKRVKRGPDDISYTLRLVAKYRIPTAANASSFETLDDFIFSPVNGKEMLLVACSAQNTVHIVDHKDGCCLLRTLDTGLTPLERPFRLEANFKDRVWVGCHGGKIHVFDL